MQTIDLNSRGIRLRELFPQARFSGGENLCVTSCSSDPKQLQPGDLFACLPTEKQDERLRVTEAVRRGATAVLCEQPLPVELPVCVVPNSREAYGHLCQALAGQPSQRLRVVGVSGTNGKTTVATLIHSVLRAAGHPTEAIGIPGLGETSAAWTSPHQSPSSAELARSLASAEAEGCTHAVVEVSSHALAEYRTAGIEWNAAVLTNIRRDHLDLHQSVGNYRKVKQRLLSQLSGHGFAVMNADDAASTFLLSHLSNPVLTVGQHRPAELTATIVERHRSEQTFLLEAGQETVPVRTKMIGDHHVTNCLLAAALGLVYGIDLPTVVRGLERVERVPGRLERIECGLPFSVFVDYARTPDTLAAGLRAIRRVTTGQLICVYGAEGDRERQQRPLLGRVAERAADRSIITNNNPGQEAPLKIVHDLLDGYDRPGRAHVLPDRERAILWALGQAEPGDSVLIAGKGNECGQRIGDVTYACDDRKLVRDWLYEHAASEMAYLRC